MRHPLAPILAALLMLLSACGQQPPAPDAGGDMGRPDLPVVDLGGGVDQGPDAGEVSCAVMGCASGICDAASGRCVSAEEACAGVCPAGYRCVADEAFGAVVCVEEARACEADAACGAQERCASGRCERALACAPDRLEGPGAAVWAEVAPAGQVIGTLCQQVAGEVDRFVFDPREDRDREGRLRVSLAIQPLAGQPMPSVEARITGEAGEVVARATTRGEVVVIEDRVSLVQDGLRGIEVRALGDGVARYTLRADVVPDRELQACVNARGRVLVPGEQVVGSTLDGSTAGLRSSCADRAGESVEQLYTLTLDAPSRLAVALSPFEGTLAGMSLRSSCEAAASEIFCTEAPEVDTAVTRLEGVLDAGTYTLVVQSDDPARGGRFALDVSVTPTACGPGDGLCVDASQAQVCAEDASALVTQPCALGCDALTGRCAALVADRCQDAQVWAPQPGESLEAIVDWRGLVHDVDPPEAVCVPPTLTHDGGRAPTDGPDGVIAARIPPRATLRAELEAQGQDVALYAVSRCEELGGACLASANAAALLDEALVIHNPSDAPLEVRVVADIARGEVFAPSRLRLRVDALVCEPGERLCATLDDGQVASARCDASGANLTLDAVCLLGCEAATGTCALPANDRCDGARRLTPGVPLRDQITTLHTASYPQPRGACLAAGAAERDAVYRLDGLTPGDVVEVAITTSFDARVWASRACHGALLDACEVGVDEISAPGVETLRIVADDAGEVFFVVTSRQGIALGDVEVLAQVTPRQCAPGAALGCASGQDVRFCTHEGLEATATCADACTGGACDPAVGGSCGDPIVLTGAQGALDGLVWRGGDDVSLPSGRSGRCMSDGRGDTGGLDTIFAIDLQAGQSVEVVGSPLTRLMIWSRCGDPSSCEALSDPARGPVAHAFAETARRVFIIAERAVNSTPAPGETFGLRWQVRDGVRCAPGASRCVDASTVEICNGVGDDAVLATCADGCAAGACVAATAQRDTCAGALSSGVIEGGIVVEDDLGNLAPDEERGEQACLGGLVARGPDALYPVRVPPGHTLHARVEAPSGGSGSPLVYVLDGCGAGATCISDPGPTPGADRARWHNAGALPRDVLVVVDHTQRYATGPFRLVIKVRTPECTPGAMSCAADGLTLRRCDAFGAFEGVTCAGGCLTDRCVTPTGDVCEDAIPLPAGDARVEQAWQPATAITDALSWRAGQHGACVIAASDPVAIPATPDTFYKVMMQPGEVLRARLDPPGDGAVVVLKGCGAPGVPLDAGCASKTSRWGARVATYQAAAVEEVILAVEGPTAAALDVSISPGPWCAPGQRACEDATTLRLCDPITSTPRLISCPQGCAGGACVITSAAHDTCALALAQPDLAPGTSSVVRLDGFAADINLSASACLPGGGTAGPDALFGIGLSPGDTLIARATSLTGRAASLYVLDDCADPAASCVAGARAAQPSNKAALTYTHGGTSPARVLLGVDVDYTTGEELVALEVDVQPSGCVAGAALCAPDGQTLLACGMGERSASVWEAEACVGGCQDGRCGAPQGDVCADAIALSGLSGSITREAPARRPRYSPTPGIHGACYMPEGRLPSGSDDFYTVRLLTGDVLTAWLDGRPYGRHLIALRGCDSDACLQQGLSERGDRISVHARQDQDVVLVVDADTYTSASAYTLRYEIQRGLSCAPGRSRCLSDQLMGLCSDDGATEAQVACAAGCALGACALESVAADTCAAASALSPVEAYAGVTSFAAWQDDVTLPSTACAGAQTPGPDAFLPVRVRPGHVLVVEAESLDDEHVALVAATSCADVAGTCVAGAAEAQSGRRARLVWANPSATQAQVLMVGLDSAFGAPAPASGLARLHVSQRPPECMPGVAVCDASGQDLLICDAFGLQTRHACDGGCAQDRCAQPGGDVCADAIRLDATSGAPGKPWRHAETVILHPATTTNASQLSPASCAPGRVAGGLDTFRAIRLAPGQRLTATASPQSNDVILYTLDGCATAGQCAQGADLQGVGGVEQLVVLNTQPTPRDVLLVLDTKLTPGSAIVELALEVQ